jgi:hypothetical protein
MLQDAYNGSAAERLRNDAVAMTKNRSLVFFAGMIVALMGTTACTTGNGGGSRTCEYASYCYGRRTFSIVQRRNS